MADQIIIIPILDPRTAGALDEELARTDRHKWIVNVKQSMVDLGAATLVVFFSAEQDDDGLRPLRLTGPAASWLMRRVVVAEVTALEPAGGSRVSITFVDAAEEEIGGTRDATVDMVLAYIAGYDTAAGLDEPRLASLLETAARTGVAAFPGTAEPLIRSEPDKVEPAGTGSQAQVLHEPARYLFSRRGSPELMAASPQALAYQVFFQMWQRKAPPYGELRNGDIVYIGDPASRRVGWEVQVTDLLRDSYGAVDDALDALRMAYGLEEQDLNDYHRDRPSLGFVLAWAPTVMRKLEITLPAGQSFGQNGYRKLDDADFAAIGLPAPSAGLPLASPPDWYEPRDWRVRPINEVPRYIPLHVREAVVRRDGGKCVGCGTTVGLHFDHIDPYAHGGQPTVENLRLLCALSNLAKGAGGPGTPLRCTEPT